jgi:hypothetical protein
MRATVSLRRGVGVLYASRCRIGPGWSCCSPRPRRRLAGLLSHGVDTLARVLEHVLRSAIAPSALPARPGDAYGGLAIVRAMARLFGWDERGCGPSGERFVAEWALPASEGSGRGDAD